MAAARRLVHIDVVSDTICPWCFIGKRRLEKAIASVASLPLAFEVQWRPFFLDPTLPAEGVDKMERYRSKFGEDRIAQMLPYMQSVGAAEGIKFDYGGKICSTLDSHALMEVAWEKGGAALQNSVCEELMKYYFEQQGNLGDEKGLLEAAKRGGLAEDDARAALGDAALKRRIGEEVQAWQRKHRISGVPFFIIDGKFKLSGAQEPSAFVEIFEDLATRDAGR
jgi:predicted DsbA family dithiol-disulfide isomerase